MGPRPFLLTLFTCGFVHRSLVLALGFVSLWLFSPRSLAPGPPAVHGPWEVPVSAGVVLVVFLQPLSCDMILLHRVYEVHVVQLCLVCHVT